ncbi:MAG TPA: ABC transporter permease [Candidatus Tectomicrobia bacterium]|nr:ABC transporter permease [Candidatus Tectomicrobia bacterium]
MSLSTPASTTAERPRRLARAPRLRRFLDAWRRFRRHRAAMAGLMMLAVMLGLVFTASWWQTHDPERQQLSRVLRPMSVENPLGTDHLGRDILARLLYGGRLSLLMGFLAVGIGLLIGVPLGALSGFQGGWTDLVIQRFADMLLSFPGFLLALSLVSILGVGVQNVIIAVGISAIPSFIRLVRSSVLSIREQVFVEAARALGQRAGMIMLRHVLPHAMAPIIVQGTLNLGSSILVAAGLGFLGLGVQPPTPEWGTMLGEGRQYIFRAPYLTLFPGLAIFLAVLGFNLLGDGLRDALDPRMKQV